MAVSSLVCVLVAMVLGNITHNSLSIPPTKDSYYKPYEGHWNAGPGLILLNTAFALMAIATPLHIITTVMSNRATSSNSHGMSDVVGAPAALMEQQQAHPKGEVTPRGRWASSSTGIGTATTTTASSSYFSHPSPYQPPNHYLPRPGQDHVSVGALPAAPVSMTPEW